MESPLDLESVLEAARRLDRGAFEILVARYSPRLFGFLLRFTANRDDAEDLVQEVFVRLVRTIGDYQHDGRFEAWLFRIAANLARDRGRKISRSPQVFSLDGVDPASRDARGSAHGGDRDAGRPDARLRLGEDGDAIQRALAALPDVEREVILLRHYSSMTFAEIASAMDTPLGTALARSHRGLSKMRAFMEQAE